VEHGGDGLDGTLSEKSIAYLGSFLYIEDNNLNLVGRLERW